MTWKMANKVFVSERAIKNWGKLKIRLLLFMQFSVNVNDKAADENHELP